MNVATVTSFLPYNPEAHAHGKNRNDRLAFWKHWCMEKQRLLYFGHTTRRHCGMEDDHVGRDIMQHNGVTGVKLYALLQPEM